MDPRDGNRPHRLARGGDRDLEDEVRFHLEEGARELEAAGMTPGDARRAARRAFGEPERILERIRRARGRRLPPSATDALAGSLAELRRAARSLARRPAFAGVVIATLGVGIGAVTAAFTLVNAAVLRALPFPEAERLVLVRGAFDAPEGPRVRGASPPEVRDWGTLARTLVGVAAFEDASWTLADGDGDAERVQVETVDGPYLELLGAEPILGRSLTASDLAPGGGAPVALIGEDLWARRWGRDPAVLGRAVRLEHRPYTVIGVLPRSFTGATLTAEAWVPLASTLSEAGWNDRGDRWLGAVARLGDGISLEEARRDLDRVAALLEERHPVANRDRVALVTPAREVYLGSTRTLLLVVLGAAALLLAVAGVNVTNLILVRSWARGGETLMRRALGAGRAALVRPFLAEGLVLSAAGTALGLLLGLWGAPVLAAATPAGLLPPYVEVTPNRTVFVVVAGVMALLATAAGIVPALAGDRRDLAAALRERGQAHRSGGRFRLQGALVAGEVALAVVLLVAAGLMSRSLAAQLEVRPGFDHERLLAARILLPGSRYPDDGERRAVMQELLARLEAEPGVERATFASDAPLRGGSSATYLWTEAGGGTDDRIRFYLHRVQPGWFETMGVALRSGRSLARSDEVVGFDVAVISRAMAERHYAGLDPVGRSLWLGRPDRPPVTIVGVADDVRWRDLTTDLVGGPTDPDVYVAWPGLTGFRVELTVRARGEAEALAGAVRRAVREVDPDLVPFAVAPLSDALRAQTDRGRFGTLLLGAFSALAVVLAAIGLFGALSFAVGRRTREIAVRLAVGAGRGDVRRLVVGRGLGVAAAGVAAGSGISALLTRTLDSFLFGVSPLDAPTYLAVAGVVVAVSALAAWIPAARATRVAPAEVLAGE